MKHSSNSIEFYSIANEVYESGKPLPATAAQHLLLSENLSNVVRMDSWKGQCQKKCLFINLSFIDAEMLAV